MPPPAPCSIPATLPKLSIWLKLAGLIKDGAIALTLVRPDNCWKIRICSWICAVIRSSCVTQFAAIDNVFSDGS